MGDPLVVPMREPALEVRFDLRDSVASARQSRLEPARFEPQARSGVTEKWCGKPPSEGDWLANRSSFE